MAVRNNRKTKKRLKCKEISTTLSLEDKLEIKIYINSGKVTKFSVAYLRRINSKWETIKWCDNAHDGVVAHCHQMSYTGKVKWMPLISNKNTADLLTEVIENFKKYYKLYLDSYNK